MAAPLAVLAAGGTGGHLFPAQALAEELKSRGFDIHLMTDERVRDYGKSFPAEHVHVVPAATLSLSAPLKIPAGAFRLAQGVVKARKILSDVKPKVVAGFGGYPSFPPLVAAASLEIPSLLHEQNAVLGRANARLANRATRIALSFEHTRGLPEAVRAKAAVTGNPVRGLVRAVAAAPYPALAAEGAFHLVVFGGSQGARYFSDVMPDVVAQIFPPLRSRLRIVQQCRPEDLERVQAAYAKLDVSAELAAFFPDLPRRIAQAHLVVSRSGASTIAELGVIGRPAILVPLPHSIDNDQLRNAQSFAAAGAGWLETQKNLSAEGFAGLILSKMQDVDGLRKAAAAALTHGKPDAARALADMAQGLAVGAVK